MIVLPYTTNKNGGDNMLPYILGVLTLTLLLIRTKR